MTIETGEDLRAARERLGWSTYKLGLALRLADGNRHRAGQRVHEMEAGKKPIGGPTAVAVEGFLAGHVPEWLEE